MARPSQAIHDLAETLELTAEFRRDKAAEYPDDERNMEAALLLESLAAACRDTDQSQQGAHVTAYAQFVEATEFLSLEAFHEYLKLIGFHRWPSNPEDLCGELLAALGADAEAA
jgi:hypothetical protein